MIILGFDIGEEWAAHRVAIIGICAIGTYTYYSGFLSKNVYTSYYNLD